MRKIILCAFTLALLVGCQENNQTSTNSKMSVFKKNTETTKAWLGAFMQNDSTAFFSDKYMSEDFIWSPPAVGMDSLPKADWKKAFRAFMVNYDNKKLTNPQYFAALDDDNLPNPITVRDAIGGLPDLKTDSGEFEADYEYKSTSPFESLMMGEIDFKVFYSKCLQ